MVVMVATLLVATSLTYTVNPKEANILGNITKLIHLGTFSAWFGAQIWVSFIAGWLVGLLC